MASAREEVRQGADINIAERERDEDRAEIELLRELAVASCVVRNMRFAVDSRLTPEERRVFDHLSEAFDAWKFPESKP